MRRLCQFPCPISHTRCSVRVANSRRINRKCSASTTTSASRSQASHQMRESSGMCCLLLSQHQTRTFFSPSRAAILCASKPWAPRWCSTDPSPSTGSYPPSPIVRCVSLLHSCGEADASYQRPKSTPRNTAGVHTASASLSSGWTTQAHTCTSSHRAVPRSNTSPSRSVRAVRAPRLTLRSTLSPLPTVHFPCLSSHRLI